MVLEVALQAFLIGAAFGLAGGWYIARVSHRRDPVQGGLLAQLFHVLGASAFISSLPGTLAALLLGGGLFTAVPLAFSFLGLSLLFLLIYSIFEAPARRDMAAEDEAWTAEKARTSGL